MKTLALFFFFVVSKVSGDRPSCPPLVPPGDISDPAVAESINSQIVNGLLTREWEGITPESQSFLDILKGMAASNDPNYGPQRRVTSESAILTISALLPRLEDDDPPSLCAFADMVNGNVDFLLNNNCESLQNGLNSIGISIASNAKLLSRTAILNSQCSDAQFVTEQQSCNGGGTTYRLQELLDALGDTLEDDFKDAILALYGSQNPIDQLVAGATASAATPGFRSLISGLDNSVKFQIFYMIQTEPLPKPCCGAFGKALRDLLESEATTTAAAINNALQQAGCSV